MHAYCMHEKNIPVESSNQYITSHVHSITCPLPYILWHDIALHMCGYLFIYIAIIEHQCMSDKISVPICIFVLAQLLHWFFTEVGGSVDPDPPADLEGWVVVAKPNGDPQHDEPSIRICRERERERERKRVFWGEGRPWNITYTPILVVYMSILISPSFSAW